MFASPEADFTTPSPYFLPTTSFPLSPHPNDNEEVVVTVEPNFELLPFDPKNMTSSVDGATSSELRWEVALTPCSVTCGTGEP